MTAATSNQIAITSTPECTAQSLDDRSSEATTAVNAPAEPSSGIFGRARTSLTRSFVPTLDGLNGTFTEIVGPKQDPSVETRSAANEELHNARRVPAERRLSRNAAIQTSARRHE